MTDNAIVLTNSEPGGEFLFYQTEDGDTRVQMRLLEETVLLTQRQMADLFQKDVRTVHEHIRNTTADGKNYIEPVPKSTYLDRAGILSSG